MNALECEAVDAADELHEAIKKLARTWRKVRPLTKRINRGHQPEMIIKKLNQWAEAAANGLRNDAYMLPKNAVAKDGQSDASGDTLPHHD